MLLLILWIILEMDLICSEVAGLSVGDITAVSFNATAGKGFIQRYSSTSADNFNVTVIGGSFRNLNDSMIDANSFNVIAGTYFANESVARINVDNFNVTTGTYFANNSDSVIRAVSFNVTSERDFVNDITATINVQITSSMLHQK